MSCTTCRGAAAAILVLGLVGCAAVPGPQPFEAVTPRVMEPDPAPAAPAPVNGAIYQAGQDMRLFERRTARRLGDLLTIRLQERTDASKSASTSVDKATEVGIANPTLFGTPFSFNGNTLETALESSNSFAGEGSSGQSNRLSGEISAVVVTVYPNGNLEIQGEKMLTLNQGEEIVRITGVVRPEDIAFDNSVSSARVADARITYAGRGAVADASAAGWLARFFVSALWPF